MDKMTLLLIWADGSEERLDPPYIARVIDGTLVIDTDDYETRHIPLVQLREWRTYG